MECCAYVGIYTELDHEVSVLQKVLQIKAWKKHSEFRESGGRMT